MQIIGDYVIVDVLSRDKVLPSGIIIPDTAKHKFNRGKILDISEGFDEDLKSEFPKIETSRVERRRTYSRTAARRF